MATKSLWKDASQKRDEKCFSVYIMNHNWPSQQCVLPHFREYIITDIKWQDFLCILSTKISILGKLHTLHMLFNCSSEGRKNQDALPSVIHSVAWKVLILTSKKSWGLNTLGHSPTNFLQCGDFWAWRAVSGWRGLNTGSVAYSDINAILLLSMARASKVSMNVSRSQGRWLRQQTKNLPRSCWTG